jgi:serine/threonine protein phosphatase 1
MPNPPQFSPSVAQQHHRVDVDACDDIYVVGDVHGCREALERLLARLEPGPDDLVVFVGDLVRKGPDSKGVLDLVGGAPNMVSVRGNNEEKLLRGEAALDGLDEADLAFVASLPVAISWAGGLVVHGGVDPRKPLVEHDVDELQTTRSLVPGGSYDRPYWFERYEGPPRVFFGHTVLEAPIEREGAVGLDTGCVYGGDLTAYDVRRDRFVSVPAGRQGNERASAKMVSPSRASTPGD